jgi:hypothetical protein
MSGEAHRDGQGYHDGRIQVMCTGSELTVAGFVRFIAGLARRTPCTRDWAEDHDLSGGLGLRDSMPEHECAVILEIVAGRVDTDPESVALWAQDGDFLQPYEPDLLQPVLPTSGTQDLGICRHLVLWRAG